MRVAQISESGVPVIFLQIHLSAWACGPVGAAQCGRPRRYAKF